jgi:serine protease Do
MQSKFQMRPMGVIAVAAVLAVAGFVGLRAAENQNNPPATVRTVPSSYAAPHHGGYAAMVKEVVPAVVNISSTKMVKQQVGQNMVPEDLFRQFFGDQGLGGDGQQFEGRQFNVPHGQPREQKETGTGSGVIVSPNGYILTNNHVVDGATEVTVTLHDRREFKAKVIGTDKNTDIAVIKIEGSNFPTLTLGDSSKLEVGDIVLAIGDPFGVGQTVTQGIVSATGRSGLGIEQLEDFIQTDAAINPGNSGGALVDEEGHLVAINTAIVGNSGGNVGIGFAVPINMAKHDMDSILAHGKVDRGYLGVHIQDVNPDLAQGFNASATSGALIGDVTPGAPAANAGLKRGDIVTELNGQPINSADQLKNHIGVMDPGAKANMKVLRDGHTVDIAVTLGSFPDEKGEHAANIGGGSSEHSASGLDGVSVQALTPDIARQLNVPPQTHGLAVSSVDQSSAAAEGGLQEGDVIMEVNRQAVTTVSELNHAISAAPQGKAILLLVNRGGTTAFVAIHR